MEILTVKEVMKSLRCKREKVYELIESGRLKAIDIGVQRRQFRVTQENLDAFLNDSVKSVQPSTSRRSNIAKPVTQYV